MIYPSVTMASMTDRICAITLRERAFVWWWIAFVPCMALTLLLVVSILYLFYAGIGIWGVSWPVAWGFAILSYVWWIAIASGGTIISALFFLMRVEMAHLDQPHRRIHDAVRRRGGRGVSSPSSGAALVRLLAVFLSEHDDAVGRSSAVRCCGISGRSTPTSWLPCCSGTLACCPTWRACATARPRAPSK